MSYYKEDKNIDDIFVRSVQASKKNYVAQLYIKMLDGSEFSYILKDDENAEYIADRYLVTYYRKQKLKRLYEMSI